MSSQKSTERTLQGVVVSDKMDKTIVVKIETKIQHETYKKYIRRSTKIKAHDEGNTCKIGDTVLIKESRPISKDKCWTLVEIKQRAA